MNSAAALSIVLVTYREGHERNVALSVWGAVAAGGAVRASASAVPISSGEVLRSARLVYATFGAPNASRDNTVGFWNVSDAKKTRTIAAHTGAAPVTPDTSHIGVPSALPTHTPTV